MAEVRTNTATGWAVRRIACHAFTLIELLVVIAIIALLIGLLLPALKGAAKPPAAAICLSNQRQIGIGMLGYAGDYKSYVAREGAWSSADGPEQDYIPWNIAYRPFVDDRVSRAYGQEENDLFERAPYFRCPSRRGSPHLLHYMANGFAFRVPGIVDNRASTNMRVPPRRVPDRPDPAPGGCDLDERTGGRPGEHALEPLARAPESVDQRLAVRPVLRRLADGGHPAGQHRLPHRPRTSWQGLERPLL